MRKHVSSILDRMTPQSLSFEKIQLPGDVEQFFKYRKTVGTHLIGAAEY